MIYFDWSVFVAQDRQPAHENLLGDGGSVAAHPPHLLSFESFQHFRSEESFPSSLGRCFLVSKAGKPLVEGSLAAEGKCPLIIFLRRSLVPGRPLSTRTLTDSPSPVLTTMTSRIPQAAAAAMRWLSSTEDGESFGVHIEYEDLYDTLLFFVAIYVSGKLAALVKMPSLVGEIVCGILLGPPLADFVPNPEAFVLLGELG